MEKLNKKTLFTFLFVLIISNIFSEEKKKNREIEQINHSIIYDLFLNMELTNRNHQIVVLYDYIPHLKKKKEIESIEINSSLENDYNENIVFLYDKENRLKYINYTVKRSQYESAILFKYELKYKNDRVDLIYVKNRLLYKFIYNSKGKLKIIKHFSKNDEIVKIYNVLYSDSGKEVKFSLDVIRKDNVYFDTNNSKDFIFLNNKNKISKLKFDIYNFKNILYSKENNISSFSFSRINEKTLIFKWDYTKFDDNKNWLERKKDKYLTKRKFNYK